MVITRTTRNRLIRKGPWVRIPPSPPRRSKLCIACSDFFQTSERVHAAAPPFQTANAALVCGLMKRMLRRGCIFSVNTSHSAKIRTLYCSQCLRVNHQARELLKSSPLAFYCVAKRKPLAELVERKSLRLWTKIKLLVNQKQGGPYRG